MVESIVEELRTVVSVINGKLEIERGKGGGIPVSPAVAVALMRLDLLTNGAYIMSEISVCVCDDRGEENQVCWYEVCEEEISRLGGLGGNYYFEIWGI